MNGNPYHTTCWGGILLTDQTYKVSKQITNQNKTLEEKTAQNTTN